MRAKRSLLGSIGVVVCTLMAVLTTGPAQAAIAPGPRTSDHAQTVAAVSPTISPATDVSYRADDQTFTCGAGNLCLEVWDQTVSKWKIFYLYNCNRYYLSNWYGDGYYLNKQTGSVTSYLYDANGNVLRAFSPPQVGTQNWDPVWSVRNC
ncbi:hypothetical protein [Streptomyces shenzhenensis]|uniref:hypothetical protein n=1 Tax=Streptomyces TaxID=1883 RepID=UPI001F2C15B6|nr:hypothetical protein [Streptomyces shenzhenensis]